MPDLTNLQKSGGEFSAAERIHSWIRNPEWQEGYADILDPNFITDPKKIGTATPLAVMWSMVKSSNDYHASKVYQKAKNLVADVRDIDTCTIKSLQSLAAELGASPIHGFDYNYPPEFLDLLDILSVSKSTIFMDGFLTDASKTEYTTNASVGAHITDPSIIPFNGFYKWTDDNRTVVNQWTLLEQTYIIANSNNGNYESIKYIDELSDVYIQRDSVEYRVAVVNWLVDNFQWDSSYADKFLGLDVSGESAPEYYKNYIVQDSTTTSIIDTTTKALTDTITKYLTIDSGATLAKILSRYAAKDIQNIGSCVTDDPYTTLLYTTIPDRASVVTNKTKYNIDPTINITSLTDSVLDGELDINSLDTNLRSVIDLDIKERRNGIIWDDSTTRYEYERVRVTRRWVALIQYASSLESVPVDRCTDETTITSSSIFKFLTTPLNPDNSLTPVHIQAIDDTVAIFRNIVLYVYYHRQYLKQLVGKYKHTGSTRSLVSSVEEQLFRNFNPNSYWSYSDAHNFVGTDDTTLSNSLSGKSGAIHPSVKVIEYYDDTEYFNVRSNITDDPDSGLVNPRYWEDLEEQQDSEYRGISKSDFYSFYQGAGYTGTESELNSMLTSVYEAACPDATSIETFDNIVTPVVSNTGSFGAYGNWTMEPFSVQKNIKPEFIWNNAPAYSTWIQSPALAGITRDKLLSLWTTTPNLLKWQTDVNIIPGVLQIPAVKSYIDTAYAKFDYIPTLSSSIWLQSGLLQTAGIQEFKKRWISTFEDNGFDTAKTIADGWRDVKWINDPELAATTGWRDLLDMAIWVKSKPVKKRHHTLLDGIIDSGPSDTNGWKAGSLSYKIAYADLCMDVSTVFNSNLAGTKIDGKSLTSATRVLFNNLTDSTKNGIYTNVNSASWVRASGYATEAEIRGTYISILDGHNFAGKRFRPSTSAQYVVVDCIATVDTTINSILDTIDDVQIESSTRVLLIGQAVPSQNGIYENCNSATWYRVGNYDSDAEIRGKYLAITSGTIYGGTFAQNTNTTAITVDTTDLTYMQFVSADCMTKSKVTMNTVVGTVDGIDIDADTRVLFTAQSPASKNGIYTNVTTTTWTRVSDYDSDVEIRDKYVRINDGATHIGKIIHNTNTSAITMESTAIKYVDLGVAGYSGIHIEQTEHLNAWHGEQWYITQEEWNACKFIRPFDRAPFERKHVGNTFDATKDWKHTPFVQFFAAAPFIKELTDPTIIQTAADLGLTTIAEKQAYLASIGAIPAPDGGLHRFSEDYQGDMWDMYRRYMGTENADNPMYNYKNTIHPTISPTTYLYGITNEVQTAGDSCIYNPQLPKLERQTVETLMERIGQLGNTINGWVEFNKFQGYVTNYEYSFNNKFGVPDKNTDVDGPWIPDALRDFLINPAVFIDSISEGTSPYITGLNLDSDDVTKIAAQMQAYTLDIQQLKDKFIYQHAVDKYGNSYTLYKDAREFSSAGKIWMRRKNHPLSLPLYSDTEALTQLHIPVVYANSLKSVVNNCYNFDIIDNSYLVAYGAYLNDISPNFVPGFISGFNSIVELGYIRDPITRTSTFSVIEPINTAFDGFEINDGDGDLAEKFIGFGHAGNTIVMAKIRKYSNEDDSFLHKNCEDTCQFSGNIIFSMFNTETHTINTISKHVHVVYDEYVPANANWKLSVSDTLISCVFESLPPVDVHGGFYTYVSSSGTGDDINYNVGYHDPDYNSSVGMYANGFTTIDFTISVYGDNTIQFSDEPSVVDYFYNFTRVGFIALNGSACSNSTVAS